jgi:hypothetical protein
MPSLIKCQKNNEPNTKIKDRQRIREVYANNSKSWSASSIFTSVKKKQKSTEKELESDNRKPVFFLLLLSRDIESKKRI